MKERMTEGEIDVNAEELQAKMKKTAEKKTQLPTR